MTEEDSKVFWLVEAEKCQRLRREYMKKYFPVDERFWCIVKCCATIRQINYEVFTKDLDELKEVDLLVDEVMSEIIGQDLSGCEACRGDQAPVEES
jgi:hypothetical protein